MNKTRNSSFELMRIVSILFIILWHILIHGQVINNALNPIVNKFLNFILFILIVHVNSFALLFGFFQSESKFKLQKLIKLILQVIFYSVAILLVAIKLKWVKDYSITTFIENILPSSLANYWFIKVYVTVYVFSDFINLVINKFSRKEYKNLLIVLFIMLSIVPYITGNRVVDNNGYGFVNFIFLYFIGGYLKRYPLKDSYHFKNLSINGYRCILIFIFFALAFFNYTTNLFFDSINGLTSITSFIANRILVSRLNYSNPFVIIQTIAYFEFFRTLKFKSKIINFTASNVFGIYLFHDNGYMSANIYKVLKIYGKLFTGYGHLIYVVRGLFILFFAGLIVEILRKLIFKLVSKTPIAKKIKNKFKNFISSFNTLKEVNLT